MMTRTHGESNPAGLHFLANESTWGRVGGDSCQSSPEERAARGQGPGGSASIVFADDS